MPNNTPITDAELAEVKRLIAVAKLGPMVSVHITTPRYEHCANLCTRLEGHKSDYPVAMMQAEWADVIAATFNAFPAIIARLEAAERYRDNLEVELEEARDNANEFENDCRFALTTLASRMGYEWDGDGATADSLLEHVWQTVEEASKELQGWRHEREMTLTAFAHVRGGGDPALIGHPNGSVFGDALRGMLAARDAKQRREGAVMKLLDMSLGDLAWDGTDLRHEAESMIGDEKQYQTMLAEAQRLREGGE